MPYAPRSCCIYPGCREHAVKGSSYCAEHKKLMDKRYNSTERNHSKGKYGRTWKKIRDRYISQHPLCERCLENGKFRAAAEVHHILPVSRGGTHEESNLMALCRSCHQKIHQELGDR